MRIISLSKQLALVAGTLWITSSSGATSPGSPAEHAWPHESEDTRFAARLLESSDGNGDPLNGDDNMVQGADAGDVVDPGQQKQSFDSGPQKPVMREGGD